MFRLIPMVSAGLLFLAIGCSKSPSVEPVDAGDVAAPHPSQAATVTVVATENSEAKAEAPPATPLPLIQAAKEPTEQPPRQPDEKKGLEALIAATEPAIVRIDFSTREGSGIGSGFVIDDKGIVVTNHHVIDGATSAKAVFADGTSVRVIGVLGSDPKRDIAILKIQKPEKKLLSLRLQKSRPQKGLAVVAFGAPQGLSFSASEGIVSSVRSAAELAEFGKPLDGEWIQTTTPISPGNSGGPLVNLSGEVVGINTFHIIKGQNLNFAVSAADIERIYGESQDSNALPLAMNANTAKGKEGNVIRSLKIPPPFKYPHRYQVESKKGKFDTYRRITLGPIPFHSEGVKDCGLHLTLYVRDDERVLDNARFWILSVSEDWKYRDNRRLKFLIDGEITNFGEMDRDAEVKSGSQSIFCIESLDASIPLSLLLKIARSQTSDFAVGTHELTFDKQDKDGLRDLLSRLPVTKTVSGIALELDDQLVAEHRNIAESRKASQAAATAKAEKELEEADEKKAKASLTLAKKYMSDGKTKLAKQTLEGIVKRYPKVSARLEADELLKGLSD